MNIGKGDGCGERGHQCSWHKDVKEDKVRRRQPKAGF